MINRKDHKARIALKRGAGDSPRNYAVEVFNKLSCEIAQLDKAFQEQKLPLVIHKQDEEKDHGLVIVFAKAVHGSAAEQLLRLEFTSPPQKEGKVAVVTIPETGEGKTYHHLDSTLCVNRFLSDVRAHILSTTPIALKDSVEAIFEGLLPGSEEFKDYQILRQTIVTKYSFGDELVQRNPQRAEQQAQQAYNTALQYQ